MARRRTYKYDFVDEELEYLFGEINKRFNVLRSLLALDEVNILGEVGKLYRELGVIIRRVLLAIARYYYDLMRESEREYAAWLDEQWIEDILTGYDPVSKYVFANEEDRKRARLAEALMASNTPEKELESAARSVALMWQIYSVRVADEAALQALTDNGAETVEWVAEDDDRTCRICFDRDGNRYPIEKLPDKPHINCRCTFREVKNKYGKIEYSARRDG